jgi:secondary thiamine-phosphate synthase enzyme
MLTDTMVYDTSANRFVDITRDVARFAAGADDDGLLNVFVPHATAGVAVIETGSGSEQDLEAAVDRLLPRDERYAHAHGSPGHGADHVLPAFIAPSLVVPVIAGELALGTWQSIVVVDLNRDNARRTVRLSLIAA